VKYNKKGTVATVLTVVLALSGFAASTVKVSSANAAVEALMSTVGMKSGNAPAPTCPAPYVYSGRKPGCVPCPPKTKYDTATKTCKAIAPALSGATVAVESSSVGSFSFNLRGTIVADGHLKGTKKHSPKCGVANGYNGYKVVNGKWYYRFEKNVKYCPNPNSPTGYAKVGGGDTGKDCENPFKPGRRSPGPVLKGPITELTSFNVHIPEKAQARAAVHGQCPGIDVGGDASASGLVSTVINQRLILKAKGKASVLKALVREALSGKGIAKAVARLHLDCNMPTKTITQPGTTTTRTVTTPGTTTQITTTTTTSPPPPKPVVEVNTVQEITASDYSVNPADIRHPRLCGSVKTQPGDVLKVSFSGHEGTFDNPNLPDMTADGTKQQVCNTYTSGTDVGQGIDWITISVVDVTAKTSNSADSNHFDVVKADSNPSNP
jgi:hypothetical protein